MKKKIALIHTGFALVEVLRKLFIEIIPEVELINIIDDSLLREVLEKDEVTNSIRSRMLTYFKSAEDYNVDVIFNVCSSVGEVADLAREVIDTKIVKIDEAMAETAVAKAENIGVVATLKTTLDPTCRLIEKKAKETGKNINLTRTLCPGAFEKLMKGDSIEHDRIILKGVKKIAENCEIVVFAQGSMARLVPKLDKKLSRKVLSSPRSGVLKVKEALDL